MRAVVGLGSNVGDSIATMRAAAARIPGVVARSRVYRTAPVGGPAQPDFLNAAVLVECTDLRALFTELQSIEEDLGRVRVERWGPRTIDLDILWAETEITEPDLVIPHPRLAERAFAVLPLLDVIPDAGYAVPPGDVSVTALGL